MIARKGFAVIGIATALLVVLGAGSVAVAKPLPVTIVVTSTSDDESPADGGCTLRAAIVSSNGGNGGNCGWGTFGYDGIVFALGSGKPHITVNSDLPPISNGVSIDGATGGATRVRLDGPGSGFGLDIEGVNYALVHGMAMSGFSTGLKIQDSNQVVVTGNVIGPNSDDGIDSFNSDSQIGGPNGLTQAGPCTGDCNLISGNGREGLYLARGGTVEGNFIGTNGKGTTDQPNGIGIVVSSGGWTIGDVGAGNLVSGNTGIGIDLHGCAGCTLSGNRIGTDVTGTRAIPNGGGGISLAGGQNSVIGGTLPGAGNVISANGSDGIQLSTAATGTTVVGNRIGVAANGSALGNGGYGVAIVHVNGLNVQGAQIGLANLPTAGNAIAWNAQGGVSIEAGKFIAIRANSIHDNGGPGISVSAGMNDGILPPLISSVSPLGGTTCPACSVDIYSDSDDEGRVFQGSAVADGSGAWTYTTSVSGPLVTATATNGTNDTSAFSAPVRLPHRPDGRIRSATGRLLGDDRYNTTGSRQTASSSGARGSTIVFTISAQNDGSTTERFKVAATGSATSMFTVSYFHGTANITAAVVAGTFQTPMLSTGQGFGITVKVLVKSTATAGASVARLVTVSSAGPGPQRDAVKFVASRR